MLKKIFPYLAITGGAGSGALSAAGYTGHHGAEQARLVRGVLYNLTYMQPAPGLSAPV
ncbi:MAG: hypothetical protein IAE84_05545 [Saprospiraceae bacterium]|jgi:hypothetical protein|nr:hypothetical protein [Saprospiraceae bacterium]HRD79917.1 hypothetical protein [Saprospiraceae bacterium]